jgi:hypothetical protein
MRVSRKKLLMGLLALACIIIAVFTAVYYNATENVEENQPQGNSPEIPEESQIPEEPEIPEEPQLVIPESPAGTLGFITALAAGFGTFTIMKKRK